MKRVIFYLLAFFAVTMSSGTLTSCKIKKTEKELSAEHEVNRQFIKKKLTKKYAYDVTKIALSEKFSKIDTIIITKYDCHPDNIGRWADANYRAYVRTDGKVIGRINNQEGTFTYWFETYIDKKDIDPKVFKVQSMFAEDEEGFHVIYKYGRHDYNTQELDKMNSDLKAGREYAKKMEQNISGIQIRFVKTSDLGGVTGLYYDSDKELSNSQMRRVAKNIKVYYDFVEFSVRGKSYAYYEKEGDYVSHDLR